MSCLHRMIGCGRVTVGQSVGQSAGQSAGQRISQPIAMIIGLITSLAVVFYSGHIQAQSQRPPLIESIDSNLNVNVLESISFDIRATSDSGDVPWLWAEAVPRGATLRDSGEGYRIFDWTPDASQAGLYSIRLIAADASDQTLRSDKRITLFVSGDIDTTATPVLDIPASLTVLAGEDVSLTVDSTHPSGVVPGVTVINPPDGATFTDNGDTTRQFNWQTSDADLGTRQVTFRAVDPDTLRSSIGSVTMQVSSPSLAFLDVDELNGEEGFKITGSTNHADSLGQSVSLAGDVNADGIDDIIVGAPSTKRLIDGEGDGLPLGAAYVLFGSREAFDGELRVADLDGSNGFAIVGSGFQLAESVSHAGDLNGDGIDDVMVGAPFSTFGTSTGRVHVIYGKRTDDTDLFPVEVDVDLLDGTDGFTLNGLGEDDSLGVYMDAAGDVNGDGLDDVILGSPQGFFGPPAPGRAYVVYGRADGFPASWSVTDIDGNNGFELVGNLDEERLGNAVSGVGDVNADGIDDILVARGGTNLDGSDDTELRAFVLFGRDTRTEGDFPASVYVSEVDGYNGFSIGSGNEFGDQADSMRVSGGSDINADGIDDLVVGESWYHSDEGRYAGQVYVIYGQDTAADGDFPFTVDIQSLSADEGFQIKGSESQMQLGIALSALGDINGDGIDDVIAKAWSNNRTYVLYGRSTSAPAPPERIADLGQGDGFILINVADTRSSAYSHRVSGAGDVNGDGLSDILIGSPDDDLSDDEYEGKVYVIFGTADSRR